MSTTSFTILRPDDRHVHLRDSDDGRLARVIRFSAQQNFRMTVMPNLARSVRTHQDATSYLSRIYSAARHFGIQAESFHPDLALMLHRLTAPQDVLDAYGAGFWIWKYYPNAGTTESRSELNALTDIRADTLAMMEALNVVLCIHGEVVPDVQPDELLRELDFIPQLSWLVEAYPALRVSVEHVSDRRMLATIFDMPSNVIATITPHHMSTVRSDAERDAHSCCMPTAKTVEDMECLADAVTHADEQPKLVSGTDTAPHYIVNKDDPEKQPRGVYSSPVATPVMFAHMVQHCVDPVRTFEAFTVRNGMAFYGADDREEDRGTLTLVNEPWVVPEDHQGIKPWKYGEVLEWRVANMRWFGEAVAAK